MSGVDLKNMRRRHEENNRKSEFMTIKPGDTVMYVHPPCRPDDKDPVTSGLNYLRVRVHYQVGDNNYMTVCLDASKNPILRHPFVQKYLKELGVSLSGSCPVCKACEDENIDQDLSYQMRGQFKYAWGVTPVKQRDDNSCPWNKLEQNPSVIFAGKTINEGLMELFFDNGDITDPDLTILAKITKTGQKLTTKYKVQSDIDTLKKPLKLGAAFIQKVKDACKDKCDLFRLVAGMVREESEVSALFNGVQLVTEDDDDLDAVSSGWGESDKAVAERSDLDGVFSLSEEPAPDETEEVSGDDETLAMLDAEIASLTG